jgi:DNA-binding NarL/FixJ family response regulator
VSGAGRDTEGGPVGERAGGHQIRVLIVDDHPHFRTAATQLLESRGYEIAGEADCEAGALERVARLAPDAVLLDVNLGDGFGPRLCAKLVERDPALAVLLVSSDDFEASCEVVQASGARGLVSKAELARTDLARFFAQAKG